MSGKESRVTFPLVCRFQDTRERKLVELETQLARIQQEIAEARSDGSNSGGGKPKSSKGGGEKKRVRPVPAAISATDSRKDRTPQPIKSSKKVSSLATPGQQAVKSKTQTPVSRKNSNAASKSTGRANSKKVKSSPLPDRKSSRLNSSHVRTSRMPSSA